MITINLCKAAKGDYFFFIKISNQQLFIPMVITVLVFGTKTCCLCEIAETHPVESSHKFKLIKELVQPPPALQDGNRGMTLVLKFE